MQLFVDDEGGGVTGVGPGDRFEARSAHPHESISRIRPRDDLAVQAELILRSVHEDEPLQVEDFAGQRVLFNGSEQGHRFRCYAQAVTGGLPTPLTPEGTRCRLPSPDGRVVITTEGTLYGLEGGQVRTVPGLSQEDWPLQWSADGRWLYVRRFEGLPTKVYRVDLQTGRRELWREFLPADRAGVTGIDNVYLTPDGTSYVYCYQRSLSDLYLAEGLR